VCSQTPCIALLGVLTIRQIRTLLYDQGYTIGGARQRMVGEDDGSEPVEMQAVIRETIEELEDVLKVLKPV
jgi:DNA-binding transcriptional MerR regulator